MKCRICLLKVTVDLTLFITVCKYLEVNTKISHYSRYAEQNCCIILVKIQTNFKYIYICHLNLIENTSQFLRYVMVIPQGQDNFPSELHKPHRSRNFCPIELAMQMSSLIVSHKMVKKVAHRLLQYACILFYKYGEAYNLNLLYKNR